VIDANVGGQQAAVAFGQAMAQLALSLAMSADSLIKIHFIPLIFHSSGQGGKVLPRKALALDIGKQRAEDESKGTALETYGRASILSVR
jgi:hypothetical protein